MPTPKKKSPEQVQAEKLLTKWQAHSDLMVVRAEIIGTYRDEGGDHDVALGAVPGNLRQFSTGSFGFNFSGKVSDLSPAGIAGKGFQMSGNLTAVKSKEW